MPQMDLLDGSHLQQEIGLHITHYSLLAVAVLVEASRIKLEDVVALDLAVAELDQQVELLGKMLLPLEHLEL